MVTHSIFLLNEFYCIYSFIYSVHMFTITLAITLLKTIYITQHRSLASLMLRKMNTEFFF